MMRRTLLLMAGSILFAPGPMALAEESPDVETRIIRDNREAPQILYMIPWEDTQAETKKEVHRLVLHSLFGDLFDPVMPPEVSPPASSER